MLLSADLETKVLHIAQQEWNKMVAATLDLEGGAGSSDWRVMVYEKRSKD